MLQLLLTAILFAVGCIWIYLILMRLPRDLQRMINFYQQRNWQDISIELIIFLVAWGISMVFFVIAVGPVSWGIIKVVVSYVLFLKGMMF